MKVGGQMDSGKLPRTVGSMVVSYDFTNSRDKSILLVGIQNKGEVTVINGFQGKEAEELYLKLTQTDKKWS